MLIIGIAGGTGSGKTSLVEELLTRFEKKEVSFLSQDSYYHDTSNLSHSKRTQLNFDHPDAIDFNLLVKHIEELKNGKIIQQPVYSFKEHNRTGKSIPISPNKVLLVEGILLFTHSALRKLLDVKIYVEADDDERLIRRLKRDINQRGRTLEEILNRYQKTLKPMHQQFIAPSKEFADLIIPTNQYNKAAVDIVQAIIQQGLD